MNSDLIRQQKSRNPPDKVHDRLPPTAESCAELGLGNKKELTENYEKAAKRRLDFEQTQAISR